MSTHWRVTPDGRHQYLATDGNWYTAPPAPDPAAPPLYGQPAPFLYGQPAPFLYGPPPGTLTYQRPPTPPGTLKAGGGLAVAGGVLAALGAFLPWVTAHSSYVSVSRNSFHLGNRLGFSADGVVIVVVAVVMLVVGIMCLVNPSTARWIQGMAIPSGAIAIAAVFNRYGSIHTLVNNINGAGPRLLTASVGLGLWLVLAGGAVAVIAGLGLLIHQRSEQFPGFASGPPG